MRVFVTGSAGCLARALLPHLCELPSVSRVLGVDIKPTEFTHPKFQSIAGDIREDRALGSMKDCDALVHLAFAIAREQRTEMEMYDNNVNGTMKVFATARRAGIKKVINLSSVSVYGSGENIVESVPLAPSGKFAYACHKAEIERRAEYDYPEVVHLRSHFIFGPNVHDFLHALCNRPVYISLPEPVPRTQVVHEDDVVQAIFKVLELPVAGAFNIAAPDVITLSQFVKNGRKLMLPLPLSLLRGMVAIARRLGSQADFTWVDIIDTTLTVNCDRARGFLKWKPRYSAWDTRMIMDRPRYAAA